MFTGTYLADELRKAVRLGYTTGYIRSYSYSTMKIQSPMVYSLADGLRRASRMNKKTCIMQYFQREGVKLVKQNINSNPGLRYLAKLMLNLFWEKLNYLIILYKLVSK